MPSREKNGMRRLNIQMGLILLKLEMISILSLKYFLKKMMGIL